MLCAPRFGVPRHVGTAGQVIRISILRLAPRLAPVRSLGKMVEDDRYAGFYKQRSYKFTNK